MIKKIVLKNFKRFEEQTFDLDSEIIFVGQNNSGKTTVIQAIAAWHFALRAWLASGSEKRAIGLTRQEFSPVPLREFNQLWTHKFTGMKKGEVRGKSQGSPRHMIIEIFGEYEGQDWSLGMDFTYNNKNQIYIKPSAIQDKIELGAKELQIAHIPSFSGISIKEHEINRAYQDTLIGQGKPGDILRNLLQEISGQKEIAPWNELCQHIKDIFGYELAIPSPRGQAYIVCEYRREPLGGKKYPLLDINTAGSGFQQVLLLLAFLYARPASVLLIDEPDAHLHFNLQNSIFHILKNIVAERSGQLIIATHSEVLINATPPENIISFFGKNPHRLSDAHDLHKLQEALKKLSAVDLLKAEQSENHILFLEGSTDFDILYAWAKVLGHCTQQWFEGGDAYWHEMKGKRIVEAQEYFKALQAAYPEMKGFVLLDSDSKVRHEHDDKAHSCDDKTRSYDDNMRNIIRQYWTRYEIENYLVHPDAIKRLMENKQVNLLGPYPDKAEKELQSIMPPRFFEDPVNDPSGYLKDTKSSNQILPQIFKAASFHFPKNQYYRLAAIMKPEEIHQDVYDMLDAIADHFGI